MPYADLSFPDNGECVFVTSFPPFHEKCVPKAKKPLTHKYKKIKKNKIKGNIGQMEW